MSAYITPTTSLDTATCSLPTEQPIMAEPVIRPLGNAVNLERIQTLIFTG